MFIEVCPSAETSRIAVCSNLGVKTEYLFARSANRGPALGIGQADSPASGRAG